MTQAQWAQFYTALHIFFGVGAGVLYAHGYFSSVTAENAALHQAEQLTAAGIGLGTIVWAWWQRRRATQVGEATSRQAVATATNTPVESVSPDVHVAALVKVLAADKSGAGVAAFAPAAAAAAQAAQAAGKAP